MARILVPRSPCMSSKTVASTDWTDYFKDIINDYIVCGLDVVAGCGLNIDVGIGNARVIGLHLFNSTSCCDAICGGLAACMCNYIFAQVNNDGMCRPCNYTFTSNTTGCAPAQSVRIAKATTDCACVTAVSQTPCVDAFYHSGTEHPAILGDGSNGTLVVTTCTDLMCCNIKQYKNLTIDACQTLQADSSFIIRIQGTLTLNGTITTNCNGGPNLGGIGGGCGEAGPGGDGGQSGGIIQIFTRFLAGTGCIVSNGLNAANGCPWVAPGTVTVNGADGETSQLVSLSGFHTVCMCCTQGFDAEATTGHGGASGGGGPSPASAAPTTNFTKCSTTHVIQRLGGELLTFSEAFNTCLCPCGVNTVFPGGAGGGGRATGPSPGIGWGGSGGAGSGIFNAGGTGGAGEPGNNGQCMAGGGGGGGGGSGGFVRLVVYRGDIPAICVSIIAGNGGTGGQGRPGSPAGSGGAGGGGGGGGGHYELTTQVGAVDNSTSVLTAGCGGQGGETGSSPFEADPGGCGTIGSTSVTELF